MFIRFYPKNDKQRFVALIAIYEVCLLDSDEIKGESGICCQVENFVLEHEKELQEFKTTKQLPSLSETMRQEVDKIISSACYCLQKQFEGLNEAELKRTSVFFGMHLTDPKIKRVEMDYRIA